MTLVTKKKVASSTGTALSSGRCWPRVNSTEIHLSWGVVARHCRPSGAWARVTIDRMARGRVSLLTE
jgi:hypothetical protein